MSTIEDSNLKKIVGLASIPFACDPAPGCDNDSLSGLYLDQLFDSGLFTALEAGSASLWDRLINLRGIAIKEVFRDIQMASQKYLVARRQRFAGAIGGANSRSEIHLQNGQLVGVRLYCADVVGGIMTINTIGTFFTGTGVINMKVYDQFGNELYSYNLSTEAGKYVENHLSTPIVLNLHNDLTRNAEYFLVYNYDSTNRPYANGFDCKCGGWRPYFDRARPYFNTQTGKSYAFSQWVMPGSFVGDTDDFDCILLAPNKADTRMNGLVLRDTIIECDNAYIVNNHSWNFSQPWDLSLAFVILHKWGLYAIDYLINTPEFDRENLINKEILITTKVQLMADYEKEIKYTASEYPYDEADCYTCRDYGMKVVRP